MAAFSVRQAGRIAACAISFLAWSAGCATGTNSSELNTDPLTSGGTAGTAGTGGTDLGGTATGGDVSQPIAGMPAAGSVAVAGMGGGGASSLGGGGAGGMGGGGAGGTGGAGGAAGMAGNAGTAGAGGTPAVGFRYVKLVAISEQAGAVWSSIAELQVMTAGNAAISRAGWVPTADSEELNNESDPATAAIDGDDQTFWHTSWEPAPNDTTDAKLPHYLQIDMVTFHTVTGFSYLPRQVGKNGHIKAYEFYVSKDGVAWGTAVKTGTFPDVSTLQTVTF